MNTRKGPKGEQLRPFAFNETDVARFRSTPGGGLRSVSPEMACMFGFDSPKEMLARVASLQTQLHVDAACGKEFERLLREQGSVRYFGARLYRSDRSIISVRMNARIESV